MCQSKMASNYQNSKIPLKSEMKLQFLIHRTLCQLVCLCYLPNNIQRPHNWFQSRNWQLFYRFISVMREICTVNLTLFNYSNGIYLMTHRRTPTHTNPVEILHVHNILLTFGVCEFVVCVPRFVTYWIWKWKFQLKSKLCTVFCYVMQHVSLLNSL